MFAAQEPNRGLHGLVLGDFGVGQHRFHGPGRYLWVIAVAAKTGSAA